MKSVFNVAILKQRLAQLKFEDINGKMFVRQGKGRFDVVSRLLLKAFPNLEEFDLTDAGSFVYLNMIEVREFRRGTGTDVMNVFCRFLDLYQMPCRLTVDPYYGTDYDALQKFYRSFGFENYDNAGTELIREPKTLSGCDLVN